MKRVITIALLLTLTISLFWGYAEARRRGGGGSWGGGGSGGNLNYMAPLADIRPVQQKLKDLGYDPGPIDGVAGGQTSEALKKFQRDHDLVVDGVIGPETKEALGI